MAEKEKSKRAPKQLGDFGEQLVMHILVQYKYKSVALVDHVGADLIMSDDDGKVYAISVKTRIIPENESKNYVFEAEHLNKLKDFAGKFNMIPTVALVINDPEDTITIYMMTVEKLQEIADSESKLSNNTKQGLSVNYNAHKEEIRNTKGIFVTEFKRTSMNELDI